MRESINEPIKVGDLCIIISGMNMNDSPNIGKLVETTRYHGEHELVGKLWSVKGRDLVGPHGKLYKELQVAESWLMKITPPPVENVTKTEDLIEA